MDKLPPEILEYLKTLRPLYAAIVVATVAAGLFAAIAPVVQILFKGPRGLERVKMIAETRKLIVEGSALAREKDVSLSESQERAMQSAFDAALIEPWAELPGKTRWQRFTALTGLFSVAVTAVLLPQQFALGVLKILPVLGWSWLLGFLIAFLVAPAAVVYVVERQTRKNLPETARWPFQVGLRLTVLAELLLVVAITLQNLAA